MADFLTVEPIKVETELGAIYVQPTGAEARRSTLPT